ncbi:MAG: addiction module antitoxin, partial [Hyphomicrobiales bacterium]
RLASEPATRCPAHIDACLSGFLVKADDALRDDLLTKLAAIFEDEGEAGHNKIIRVLKSAPFSRDTWRHVDRLGADEQSRYWAEAHPFWRGDDTNELHEMIERLLKANRPRAAFQAAEYQWKNIESALLAKLLKDVATNSSESSEKFRFHSYEVEEAFKILDERTNVSADELAHLEFLYLGVLDNAKRGIPNLGRQLAESPPLFMQAIGLAYKRSDDGEDPAEWHIPNEEARSNVAMQAYRLLHNARRIPGTKDDGSIDVAKLKAWITEVRALCRTHARVGVGDSVIGELLSKAKPGKDGIWPCEPVREALEEVGTKRMAEGMTVGLYNQRGAQWRGEGGGQERELAGKYRNWSRQVAFDAPFTSRLLEQIARTYDHDAEWHDADANLRKRLSY